MRHVTPSGRGVHEPRTSLSSYRLRRPPRSDPSRAHPYSRPAARTDREASLFESRRVEGVCFAKFLASLRAKRVGKMGFDSLRLHHCLESRYWRISLWLRVVMACFKRGETGQRWPILAKNTRGFSSFDRAGHAICVRYDSGRHVPSLEARHIRSQPTPRTCLSRCGDWPQAPRRIP